MSDSIIVDPSELIKKTDNTDETGTKGEEDTSKASEETGKPSFSMPEKFQGKSAEEIVQSYTELEKELGRKNNEVGELRKLTDQYLQQELSRGSSEDPKTEEVPEVKFDDFVANPSEALGKVVDQRLKTVNDRLEKADQAQRLKDFQAANPDYLEIGQSQEFADYVRASAYRMKQFEAAQHYDLDAAADLINSYKEQVNQTAALRKAAEQGEQKKRDEALKDAGVESSGTGEIPETTFTRRQLMDMYNNRPDEYNARQPEILKAYAEGRVTN